MTKPVWEERWYAEFADNRIRNSADETVIGEMYEMEDARAQLAAAAPDLARLADKFLNWATQEDYGGNIDRHVAWREMLAEAEAALIKAGVRAGARKETEE